MHNLEIERSSSCAQSGDRQKGPAVVHNLEIERSSSCAQSGDGEKGPAVVHSLEIDRKVQQLCNACWEEDQEESTVTSFGL